MPYSIVKGGGSCNGSEWAVIKDDDGSTMGCHDTKKEAEDQIAAIYASEEKSMGEENLNLSHIARVTLIGKAEQDRLRAILQEREALEDLGDNQPFFFKAEISNNLLDSHFTHMSEKTLRNYTEDANRGVAFLKGHNWRELPIGYSLSATFEEVERQRVVTDFYTVAGISDTDDLIARMKAGLVRDVSVGFHGGQTICDICHRDFWDCSHWPGLIYESKEGDVVKQQLATFTIDDAHLSEVSGVFDGSTPEAMILKAQRHAKEGRLTRKEVETLERRYRISLPTNRVYATAPKENGKMTEEELKRLRAVLDVPDEMDSSGIVALADAIQKRLAELEPQAEEGRQYRADLIAAALAEGVRAQGNEFDKTLYETTLKSAPLAVIKRMKADWQKVADTLLSGGRATVDEDNREQPRKVTQLIPDEAYR